MYNIFCSINYLDTYFIWFHTWISRFSFRWIVGEFGGKWIRILDNWIPLFPISFEYSLIFPLFSSQFSPQSSIHSSQGKSSRKKENDKEIVFQFGRRKIYSRSFLAVKLWKFSIKFEIYRRIFQIIF
jgi:hypothetical protein